MTNRQYLPTRSKQNNVGVKSSSMRKLSNSEQLLLLYKEGEEGEAFTFKLQGDGKHINCRC